LEGVFVRTPVLETPCREIADDLLAISLQGLDRGAGSVKRSTSKTSTARVRSLTVPESSICQDVPAAGLHTPPSDVGADCVVDVEVAGCLRLGDVLGNGTTVIVLNLVGVGTEDCFVVKVCPATKLKLVGPSFVDVGGNTTMLKVVEATTGEVRVGDNPGRLVELDEIAIAVDVEGKV
jgi:hypothetical protein